MGRGREKERACGGKRRVYWRKEGHRGRECRAQKRAKRAGMERKGRAWGGKDEIIRHSVENGIIERISNQSHFT